MPQISLKNVSPAKGQKQNASSTKSRPKQPPKPSKLSPKVKPPSMIPSTLAQSMLRSRKAEEPSTLSTFMQTSATELSNTKEIRYRITDFFDKPAASKLVSYWFAFAQTLTAIGSPSADFNNSGLAWTRPKKATLYCLPRSNNAANASSSFAVSSGVPVSSGEPSLAGTSCKIVKPDFNVKWQHCATFDYSKIFSDALVTAHTSGEQMCLFQAACVDPDDGNNFEQDIQFMVVIDAVQSVPSMCQITAEYTSDTTWGAPTAPTTTVKQFALVQPTAVTSIT